jgi:hypothetical protein
MSRPIAKARRCDCDECGSGKFKTRQSLREHQAAAHWPRTHVQISQQGPSPVACSLRDRSRSRRPLQCGAGEACSSVGCLRTSDLKTLVLRCKPFLKALGRDRLVGWEEVRGSFRPDGKLNQPSASRASEGARASLLRVNTCSEEAQLTTASPAFDLRCILAFARSRGAPSQFDDFDGESEDSYGDRSDEEDEDEDEDGADSLRPSASLPLNLTLFKAS